VGSRRIGTPYDYEPAPAPSSKHEIIAATRRALGRAREAFRQHDEPHPDFESATEIVPPPPAFVAALYSSARYPRRVTVTVDGTTVGLLLNCLGRPDREVTVWRSIEHLVVDVQATRNHFTTGEPIQGRDGLGWCWRVALEPEVLSVAVHLRDEPPILLVNRDLPTKIAKRTLKAVMKASVPLLILELTRELSRVARNVSAVAVAGTVVSVGIVTTQSERPEGMATSVSRPPPSPPRVVDHEPSAKQTPWAISTNRAEPTPTDAAIEPLDVDESPPRPPADFYPSPQASHMAPHEHTPVSTPTPQASSASPSAPTTQPAVPSPTTSPSATPNATVTPPSNETPTPSPALTQSPTQTNSPPDIRPPPSRKE
jgi:hypothetical protein